MHILVPVIKLLALYRNINHAGLIVYADPLQAQAVDDSPIVDISLLGVNELASLLALALGAVDGRDALADVTLEEGFSAREYGCHGFDRSQ